MEEITSALPTSELNPDCNPEIDPKPELTCSSPAKLENPEKSEKTSLRASIPLLNKDTVNGNTYDFNLLLDSKVQKEALSGHRIKNSYTVKVGKVSKAGKSQPSQQGKTTSAVKAASSASCKLLASEIEKKQKIEKMREEKIKDELRECTFAPKILENRKKRSPEEYFKDQMTFEEKKKEKVMNRKKTLIEAVDNEVANLSFVPNITEKSIAMASKHVYDENRFERLSKGLKPKVKEDETRESTEEKSVAKEEKNDFTFTPSLNIRSKNMLRMAPVEEILYDDAKRRQKSKNENKVLYSYEVNVNSNSEKVLIEKFYKDFVEICDFDNLCFSDLNMILQGLHMALGSDKNSSKEKDLSFRLWDRITAGQESVTSEKLLMHLMAIMKYQTSIYTDSSEAISPEETDTLHNTYKLFYENRNSIVNHRSSKLEPIPSFHPEISLNSKKILEDTTVQSIIKRREIRKMEVIQEMEEKAIGECTFQPMITSTCPQLSSEDIKNPLFKEYVQISSQPLNHRAELLYSFASIEKEKKEDFIKAEKEKLQEKELADCTFAPNCKGKPSEKPNLEDIRKCVDRLAVCKSEKSLQGKKPMKKSSSTAEDREKKLREWDERKLKESRRIKAEAEERKRLERELDEEKRRKVEEEKKRKYERLKKVLQEKKVRAEIEKKANSKVKAVSVLGSEEEDPSGTSMLNSEISEVAKVPEII